MIFLYYGLKRIANKIDSLFFLNHFISIFEDRVMCKLVGVGTYDGTQIDVAGIKKTQLRI